MGYNRNSLKMDSPAIENGNAATQKSKQVTLEEALELAGNGIFKYCVIMVSGLNLLAGINICTIMAFVIPAAECDLELSARDKGVLTSVCFTGMLFSSHLFGFLSDTYGRRFVVIRCNLVCALLCIFASIAPNFTCLAIIWFANGFVVSGTITPIYVMVSEFCHFKVRTKCLLICAAISSLVSVYLTSSALLIMYNELTWLSGIPLLGQLFSSPWRLYLAVTCVPLLVGTVSLRFLPESPKYLLAKGHKSETLDILRRIYRINTKNKPEDYPVEDIRLDTQDNSEYSSEKQGILNTMLHQTRLLFRPPFLSYMVVSCAANLGLIGAYNVIMLWLPENISQITNSGNYVNLTETLCDILGSDDTKMQAPDTENFLIDTAIGATYGGQACNNSKVDMDVYEISMIIGLLQFVTFGLSSILTNVIGRKTILVSFIILSSVCCFLVNYVPIPYTIICLGLIVVLLGAVLPIAISIIVDFFPTHVRGMATCISMIFGRLGATAGSQLFGVLQSNYCQLSYHGLAAFLTSIGLLCLIVPLKRSQ